MKSDPNQPSRDSLTPSSQQAQPAPSAEAKADIADWFYSLPIHERQALLRDGATEKAFRDQAVAVASQRDSLPVAKVRRDAWYHNTVEWSGAPLPAGILLYASPVARQPLPRERVLEILESGAWTQSLWSMIDFARAIERAHGIAATPAPRGDSLKQGD